MKFFSIVICMFVIAAAVLPVFRAQTHWYDAPESEFQIMHLKPPLCVYPQRQQRHYCIRNPVKTSFVSKDSDTPVAATQYHEYHPAIARDDYDLLFGAYVLETDKYSANIIYTLSTDQGDTWIDQCYFPLEGRYDYPSLIYWGDTTFYGTFVPDNDDLSGAAQYLLYIEDPLQPESWLLSCWDWSSYYLRENERPDIAGYSDVGAATWWYGVQTTTASCTHPMHPGEHIPVFYFPEYTNPNSGWCWWWPAFNNTAHASVSIDRTTGKLYAVWDYPSGGNSENKRDILLAIADVHDWWMHNWQVDWYQLGVVDANEQYPDVSAHAHHIQIVCQSDAAGTQDIVCITSSDGGMTWNMSRVTDDVEHDELYPTVISYGREATSTYVSNGNLYSVSTGDGGGSWSSPIQINDNNGTVDVSYRTSDITTDGNILWTDIRSENPDVYYDHIGGASPSPIIKITIRRGGIGVFAAVTNSGTADATNVSWFIEIHGGLFGRIHKKTTGVYPLVAPGKSFALHSGWLFGFGRINLQLYAICDEGSWDKETRSGLQILIFTKIRK
ncbi:MAG: hypothetical protein QXL17_03440 [Candidatus Thermoplasmatota archaeon]